MLSKSILESYLTEIEKGMKTLNSYKMAFAILAILISGAALIGLSLLGIGLLDKGFFDSISMDTLGSILKQNTTLLHIGYVAGGCMLLSVLIFRLHSYMLKRKLNNYIKNHHEVIVNKHKNIFKDHSDDAIQAFLEERKRDVLIETLETQTKNMNFFINNYENFNDEYEEIDNKTEEVDYSENTSPSDELDDLDDVVNKELESDDDIDKI